MTSYVWRQVGTNEDGSVKNGWVEKPKSSAKRVHGISVFEEVTTPDGERIANRDQMADYTRRTGMTCDIDSLKEKTQMEMARRVQGAGGDRKEQINRALEMSQSSGYRSPNRR